MKLKKIGRKYILLSLLAAVVSILAAWALPYLVKKAISDLRQGWVEAVFAAGILLFGIALYKFRQRYQFFYGLMEIVFAVFAGSITAAKLQRELFSGSIFREDTIQLAAWFSVFAFVYVTVRGADNFMQGLIKLESDPDYQAYLKRVELEKALKKR